MMIPVMLSRPVLARVAGSAFALVLLTGCDKLKEMMNKNADAGTDAAVVVVAPVPSAPEDAGVPDAAPAVVVTNDELPLPDSDDVKANRDIGFGNYKDELGKLEKEVETAAAKK